MPFAKGQSGNPAGRKRGTKNKRTLLSAQLEEAGSAVQAVVIKRAVEDQDMHAASLVMARVNAPLKPRAAPVEFQLDLDAPLAEQSKSVLAAVAAGELDMDAAKDFMDLLAAHAGMQDMATFLSELHRLKNAKPHIPGGVQTT